MTATLLTLSNGHLSLEFDTSDLPAVREAIRRRYGEPSVERYVTLSVLRFADSSFTFQNDWDDPCLISGSAEGDDILKALHDDLYDLSGSGAQ